MKRNNILFLGLYLLLAITSMTSCSDWLDVKPEGTPNNDNFWKTDAQFESATVALYACFYKESPWGRDLFWEQGAADDIFLSRSRGNSQMNLVNLKMDGQTEGSIKDIYNEMYRTMAIANNIIEKALKHEDPTPVINRVLGEAYFMRAFAHYMIAYRYGLPENGVPFVRYEDFENYVPQIPDQLATVMDNYALILEDLENAEMLLPWFETYPSEDWGRATKDASIALQVKVNAYWAEHDATRWEEIPSLVDRLEDEGGRRLMDNYADVFTVKHEWGSEYIWSVNSSGPNKAGSIFPGIMLDNKGWGRYNGWGNFKPTLELWAEFDERDARRPVTVMQYGDEFVFFGETRRFYSSADLECGFHFNKYMDPYKAGSVDPNSGAGISPTVSTNGNRPTTDLNVPLIRFAEMVLFKAEALIEMGAGAEAAVELNRISHRAGLGDRYAEATIEDLMHERRCELAGEFTDRLMDLKRWSAKYPEVKSKIEAPKHGLKYLDRSNPDSALDLENGVEKEINDKRYKGVIEIVPGKEYNPAIYRVLPYEINEVIKSQGKLVQNPGYASK